MTTTVNGAKSKAQEQAEKTAKARRWVSENLYSRRDLAKIPPPVFLIDTVYVEGTLANVFGDSGDGKTFVVLDQVLCIATGKPWLGRATTQGKVFYLCGEGVSGILKRVEAWEAEYNDGLEVPDDAFRMFGDVTALTKNTSDGEKLLALTEAIGKYRPSVIVVDTLHRYSEGVEENSSTDMGRVIAVVDSWAKNTGATVIVVHHTTRGSSHARGSNSVRAALETELYVRRTKDMSGVIEITKQKNGPDGEEIPFELASVKDSLVVRGGSVDPFATPSALVTGKSAYFKRVAWVLWSIWHDTGGATKSEARTALQGDPDLKLPEGKKGTRGFFDAWSALERKGYLEAGSTPSRFVLTAAGVSALGFTPELLEYVRAERSGRGHENGPITGPTPSDM